MSIAAFDGAAGCGKTFSVMEQLAVELEKSPLQPNQRVLALTYMHGARHRLDEQLEKIPVLRGRYEASTIDSFAWSICRRWTARLRENEIVIPDPTVDDAFDEVCRQAAFLLEAEDVRKWVATDYPYLLVDEAQDLDQHRLSLIGHLLRDCCILLAFDEFQCLNSANRPVAVVQWIAERCEPKRLTGSKRTNVGELLAAALQVRSGQPITADGACFKVKAAPASKVAGPMLAATTIAYVLRKKGTFAILSPAKPAKSAYVRDIIEALRTKQFGNAKDVGPFPYLRWESGGDDGGGELRTQLLATDPHQYDDVASLLAASNVPAARQTATALRRLRDARGQREFGAAEVVALFDRSRTLASQFGRRKGGSRRLLTIHQAKNREFDHVVIIWPYQIPSDPDDRRRLIYNAITRAKKSCVIIVQAKKMLSEAPFK